MTPDGMPLGPIIAAIIVAVCMGWSRFKEWLRQLVTLRSAPGWYGLAPAAPVLIIFASVLINYAFGAPLPTAVQLAGWTELPAAFIGILIYIGIGEEAGWTAFAAPELLKRHTFVKSWVILAAVRVLWHLPLMLSGELTWVLGIGGNIAFQYLVLWMFTQSRRVWLLAAIWHATLNTVGGQFFFPMVAGVDQARLGVIMTLLYIGAAVIVSLLNNRRRGVVSEQLKRAPVKIP